MTRVLPTPIELQEFRPRSFAARELSQEDIDILWRQHGRRIAVEFPSPRTEDKWRLRSQGWVGFLPVSPTLALRLSPKVPLENIFRMLEVAYHLKGFELLPGLADCRSLEDFFERMANILALRVLARSRKGFYQEYVGRQERLAAVRGRIDLSRTLRTPWRIRLDCQFEEHTADIGDNRLLLWTLDRIRRNTACRRPEVRQTVRTAFGRLQGVVSPEAFTAADCIGRTYTRLNDDYQVLHALCRFFLEHTGPSHEGDGHQNLPFLVDMARLFELFVAEWLRQHLRHPRSVSSHRRVHLDPGHRVHFDIDLVLFDRPGGTPLAVLDTKYKDAETPSTTDIAQVVAYAEAMGCNEAVLVFPIRLEQPLDLQVGRIRVRAVGFELGGDLEEAGTRFLDGLR